MRSEATTARARTAAAAAFGERMLRAADGGATANELSESATY